ncbi:hypothetical protein NHX12_026290 [Muraenolepis orangiensis]|uniref:MAM domain-containing protein n=1 Tax=Muraenolepis orangiensis TaxID=630683 RepID=A0A9Q0EH81_9TELE|nr:hypothetical protein NHX12_026290 [Muraenolepis orangiensis]
MSREELSKAIEPYWRHKTSGSCTFEEGLSQCDYQQDPYDDFDWTPVNTQEVPYVSPDLPQGVLSGSPTTVVYVGDGRPPRSFTQTKASAGDPG